MELAPCAQDVHGLLVTAMNLGLDEAMQKLAEAVAGVWR